jgi:hypothetical protein
LMMKKFWRLIQILLIGDFDVSLQGGRFGDWWARLSTLSFVGLSSFGYFWNCAGQWVDDWTPIHTWLTAPVKSCAVVIFPREYNILTGHTQHVLFKQSWTARSKLPDCVGCRFCVQLLLLPVISSRNDGPGRRIASSST